VPNMLPSPLVLTAPAVHHGLFRHHGVRLVVPVVLVAAIAVAIVVLVQRSRARRPPSGPPPAAGAPAREPGAPGPQGMVSRDRPTWRGRVAGDNLVIEAKGLTKRYGEKLAVDDLSFAVTPGHVTGFLGPNGAGKSTTMRLIMGLDLPNAGSVTVNGRPYHGLAWPLHEVGALLEANAIHPGRSAYAHLWMLARTNHIPRRRVDEVLHFVGLSSVARQRAGQFSLGMSQRLGIAAALLGDPGVLMFDEPVNGLDTDGIRWVRGLLRRLASEGRTVFVSSHLMSEMAQMADHVVVIGKGRLIADMAMDEFTSRHSQRYVRVRSPHLDRLVPALEAAGASTTREGDGSISVRGVSGEDIGALAWRQSILLHELAPQSASLEEAFIESTEGDIEYRGGQPQGAEEDIAYPGDQPQAAEEGRKGARS
jgi:ABC-2 type transport system ATP-binding protein